MEYKQPEPFSMDDPNLWLKWKQRFNIFLLASGKHSESEEVKIALLLYIIGESSLDVYNTFSDDKTKTLKDVLECFDSYFLPKKNITMETFKFNNINQKEEQNIESYIIELRNQAASCEFVCTKDNCKTSYVDRMIRDRIILGTNDKDIQQRLIREPNMTLEKIKDYCKSIELSKQHIKLLVPQQEDQINALGFRRKPCRRCNYQHPPRQCPAFNNTCVICQKKGHFAKLCFFKDGNDVKTGQKFNKSHSASSATNNEVKMEESESTSQIQHVYQSEKDITNCKEVTSVNYQNDNSRNVSAENNIVIHEQKQELNNCLSWYEYLQINDCEVRFKLDTGAESSILPLKYFKKLSINQSNIYPSHTMIVSYGNFKTKILGYIILKCYYKNIKSNVKFLIVDLESEPLLGLRDCIQFNLISRVDFIQNKLLNDRNLLLPKTREQLYKEFSNIFEGLGCMPGAVNIKLKPDAIPVIQTQRKVPLALHDKLKQTLNELECKNIVSKVEYPTEWVNSLMIVEKPNGSLRLCLDPKPLNRYICREHFLIPKCEDILSQLKGKTVFTVIDMKDGFWQIQLNEESSNLCTFNTPFGRYKFNRVPFGLCSIPEIFQRKNMEIFGDIPGVNIYFDDLIISGANEALHDQALKLVIERALKFNVKFNFEKLQYKSNQVTFVGQTINKEGIQPSNKNTEAVLKMETPKNKKDLLRILGMFKFFSKFIPNLSQLTFNMRNLTRKDIKFDWTNTHQEELDTLKTLITNCPILKTFDVNKSITIQTDSSSKGMGSVLLQDSHPVAFVSRSLNRTEVKYAQIEKELLSIVFACEKFHFWIYGRDILIQTDHKPLMAIFKKNLDDVSARLQRMLLKLLKYRIKIEYLPGSKMYVADTLSRAYLKTDSPIDLELDYVIHSLSLTVPMTKEKKAIFKNAIIRDPILSQIKIFCSTNWPKNLKKLNSELKYFYNFKDNIYLSDDLLFFNTKIIVPAELKHDMLKLIHSAHFGIQKCKLRAREIMFWRNMNKDIENVVNNCELCQLNKPLNQKETLVPHKIPDRPWQYLFSDFFEYNQNDYLLIVDSYSHWLEIFPVKDKTAKTVVQCCKDIFSKFGVPDIFYADNNPYNSIHLKDFAKHWNFELEFSSPYHHQSNGLAEKYVNIAKNMLKKMKSSQDLPHFLLEYRNTPLPSIGYAPSQLLLNRIVKTKMPTTYKNLYPKIIDQEDITSKLINNSNKIKQKYDETAKDLPDLEKDDGILFQKNNSWNKGKILKKYNDRSYLLKDFKGDLFRRNRKLIRKTNISMNKICYSKLLYEDVDLKQLCTPTEKVCNISPNLDSVDNYSDTNFHSLNSNVKNNLTPDLGDISNNNNRFDDNAAGNNIQTTTSTRNVKRPSDRKSVV